ncbi:MAG: hypothetical protein RJB23_268, partial [Pseudomonadota bacterium]
PQVIQNPYRAIFSNNDFLKKLLSIDTNISLQSLDMFRQDDSNQDTLIVFEDEGEINRILEMIWNNFKKRKIRNLNIYLSYQDQLLHINNQFIQLFKVWKKTNNVKNYFNVH